MNRRISLSLYAIIGGVCIYSLITNLNADVPSNENPNTASVQSNDEEEIRHLRTLIDRMKKINKTSAEVLGDSQPASQQEPANLNNENQTFYTSSKTAPNPMTAQPQIEEAQPSYAVQDISQNDHSHEVLEPGYNKYSNNLSIDSVWASHLSGRGVGYNKGYTTIGALFHLNQFCFNGATPFLDVRGHYLHDGKWAANVGIGARWWNECFEKTIGANIYYDYRRGNSICCKDTRDFNQIGFGLELLGCCYDLRLNAYFPVGRRSESSCPTYTFYPGDFFAAHRHRKRALPGVDAEIETRLLNWYPCLCWDAYGAIGPYYYASECGRDCAGGRLRLGVDFWDFFTFEVRASYDSMFHGIFQGLISLKIPLYRGAEGCDCGGCWIPIIRPVQRQEIIVLSRKHCVWDTNF